MANVFISYSHKDKTFLDELRTMLAPAIRAGTIDPWDDTRIEAGEQWRDEIAAEGTRWGQSFGPLRSLVNR